jgi:hypothetical protein
VTESEPPPVYQLRELVLRRLAELGTPGSPMSAREAARRAHNAVSFDTIYLIANGKHSGRIKTKVAEGLAAALDVPVAEVYEAAGMPRPQGRWILPERFDQLDIPQRRLIEELCAALLDADAKGYERGRRDTHTGGTGQ